VRGETDALWEGERKNSALLKRSKKRPSLPTSQGEKRENPRNSHSPEEREQAVRDLARKDRSSTVEGWPPGKRKGQTQPTRKGTGVSGAKGGGISRARKSGRTREELKRRSEKGKICSGAHGRGTTGSRSLSERVIGLELKENGPLVDLLRSKRGKREFKGRTCYWENPSLEIISELKENFLWTKSST